MLFVGGIPLLADILQVLQELKEQLKINGVERFAKFVVGQNNIQFNCPIHSGGMEARPSCGILTSDKNGVPAGTVHCFSCGYIATLDEMVSHCFGYDDMGLFGRQWLAKNFLTVAIADRKSIKLDISRKQTPKAQTYITEKELEKYRYYHPYMYKRKLTDEIIERFDVGYDDCFSLVDRFGNAKNLRCITFPVRDITGGTLFIARRSIDTKLFHYPEGVEKPVYGVYELPQAVDEIIVCESVIDALTCYVYGRPAVALLGLGSATQYEQLKKLNCRKYITAFDGDKAGASATIKFKRAMSKYKLVAEFEMPKGKDINDLTQSEFDNLIESY